MKLTKAFLLFLTLLFSFTSIFAQEQTAVNSSEAHGLVKWLTFSEAEELNKKMPKPFLIDFYTDWCGWCKHMMKTTYSTPELAAYVNNWYYPVKFNAETKDTVYYRDTAYVNKGSAPRSAHELAIKFLGERQSYPSTVFVTNNFQFILQTSGYLDVPSIEPLLIYVLENIFRSTLYEEFKVNFQKTFRDSALSADKEKLKWYSLNEALELNKKNPKNFLINIYTGFCNGCRVMNKTTFPDSLISGFLNTNFYLVDLNAERKEPILFNGINYVNEPKNGSSFHPVIPVLTGGGLSLPTLVFMDENLQRLDVINFYLTAKALYPVLNFYGTNAYKSTKWDDFVKNFMKDKNLKTE